MHLLRLMLVAAIVLTLSVSPTRASSDSAVVARALSTHTTFVNVGVVWVVDGDTDRDSSMTLEFREPGAGAWRPAAPAMRAYPTTIVDGAPLGLNSWGASAMFLQPNTQYELRATLTDPDGGSEMRIVTATTRFEPQAAIDSVQRYVVPGSGGGDGSQANPFRGLQAAADAAQPGDVFAVAGGNYAPFTVSRSGAAGRPIVFRGPAADGAVVNGAGTARGVVTLADGVSWVIIEGLTIQNGAWGVDAQATRDIVVRGNTIRDVDFGVYNRRDGHLEQNQTVVRNTIVGRVAWPNTGIPPERGIDLRGDGNVVAFNSVRNFGDCISLQPLYGLSYGNDVYGNDASFCVDDGIEIDYNYANTRVWRNRVTNARMGVSVQPIRGGPAYVLRNVLFNLESNMLKLNNQPSGVFVFHNTSAKLGNGLSDPGVTWRNVQLRNNIVIGTRYAFEFTTARDEGFRDFNYNAWHTTHADGGPGDPDFKWENVRYQRLPDLQAIGVETNGMVASLSHLVNAALPSAATEPVAPDSRNLALVPGAPEIDAGQVLPNVNDPFVSDGKPDIGAFETGMPVPQFGPSAAASPLQPDWRTSRKMAGALMASNGQAVTYTISVVNTGAALTLPLAISDRLPAQLVLIPSSASASTGALDLTVPNTLQWRGVPPVTITYAATVTAQTSQWIVNTAVLSPDGALAPVALEARVLVAGRLIFLPVLRR
jgi:uncharacterized repeat protein (TIGR01451 family)